MKFSFCFIFLILISSISAQVENENTYLNSIEIINGNNTQNFVELRIIIADNEIGNFMIFNIKGQKIMSKQYFTGEHRLSLLKLKYGSGLFFYKLRTNSYFKSGKIIMLK
ncbi:MAG: T9SS type A sorting domain-containing protein [Candidatus Cloacimonetes bacterium]|nr:T9SS type A sorting domain-containing protein [Candidatus Cloacimonadota bacterium]